MERAELSQALLAWRRREAGDGRREPILISEPDPVRFMAAFAAAVAGDSDVFLCDPNWGVAEKAQVQELLKSKIENPKSKIARGWLMIPTGGSSGTLRHARHDQNTIAAAVQGFTQHFALLRVNAVGVLPLHHVSGFMAWMRCVLTGGEFRPLDWKRLETGELPELPAKPDGWVISLVPTQLERLLGSAAAVGWLRRFRMVLLGGAPAWPALLERAATLRLPLSFSYGMTETAAMVTALRPEEFLAGLRTSGTALPHFKVRVTAEETVSLEGDSVFRGYYPGWQDERHFLTGDLGRMDERGHLTILGRRDGVIISGGEKIQPAEIEAMLRSTGEFEDVVVVGIPDPEWGESVAVVYPANCHPDLAKVESLWREKYAAYKRPKHYVALGQWERGDSGKVDRTDLVRTVEIYLRNGGK